jgi:hypothetical protein
MDISSFKTRKTYRAAGDTAGFTKDFTAADGLGRADAVLVNVIGADRTITLDASGEGSDVFTIQDGRSPVFTVECDGVTIAAGTSADIEIIALYLDRWS